MKREIYGRKAGSQGEYELLMSADGASHANTERIAEALHTLSELQTTVHGSEGQQASFRPFVDFMVNQDSSVRLTVQGVTIE